MSGFLASILRGVLGAIPAVIQALRPARAAGGSADADADDNRTRLDAPLGESRAQRALRLEEERRADVQQEITRRGED